MAISRADFYFVISELVTRNPNLGISALAHGLFANLLIFNHLSGKGKGKEKGKGKGKREGRKGKGKG